MLKFRTTQTQVTSLKFVLFKLPKFSKSLLRLFIKMIGGGGLLKIQILEHSCCSFALADLAQTPGTVILTGLWWFLWTGTLENFAPSWCEAAVWLRGILVRAGLGSCLIGCLEVPEIVGCLSGSRLYFQPLTKCLTLSQNFTHSDHEALRVVHGYMFGP